MKKTFAVCLLAVFLISSTISINDVFADRDDDEKHEKYKEKKLWKISGDGQNYVDCWFCKHLRIVFLLNQKSLQNLTFVNIEKIWNPCLNDIFSFYH